MAKSPKALSFDGDETPFSSKIFQTSELFNSIKIGLPDEFGNTQNQIDININDIEETDKHIDIRLRKIVVVENGEAKNAYVLMSQPF